VVSRLENQYIHVDGESDCGVEWDLRADVVAQTNALLTSVYQRLNHSTIGPGLPDAAEATVGFDRQCLRHCTVLASEKPLTDRPPVSTLLLIERM